MLLEDYLTGAVENDTTGDVDLVDEFETVDRVLIAAEDCAEQISVKYRPKEITENLVSSVDWDYLKLDNLPETTVMVVDEHEVIDDLDTSEEETDIVPWDPSVPIGCNGERIEVNT